MAIKNLVPQLAERGKIKIGGLGDERKKQGKDETYRLPVKYDYFLITTVQRDTAGRLLPDTALMDRLKQAQGSAQKLVEIPVRLLYDDIDLNFLTRYSCYVGNRCWCTGDGEKAERLNEKNKYEPVTCCPCERSGPLYPNKDKCKIMGTFQVLIEGVDRIGGVWKFRSTSWNTVTGILSSLALIKTITGGPLAGIPLWMVLSPKTVTIPGSGQSMVVYVVSLEYRGPETQLVELGYEIARKRLEHRVKMEQIETEARKMLVAPHAEPIEEQAETGAEFYPDGFLDNPCPEPGTTEGAAFNRTEMPPDPDPLNLDGGEAVPEQVFTIPRETMWTQEEVPPGYDGLISTHPQTNGSGSNNGRRKSSGERLF